MSVLSSDGVLVCFGSFQLTVELFDYLDCELKLSESGEEAAGAGPSHCPGLLSNSFALWSGMEFREAEVGGSGPSSREISEVISQLDSPVEAL